MNATAMEAAIAAKIACELGGAIDTFYNAVKDSEQKMALYGFVFDWIIQTTLTFTVDEQSTLNPVPSFTHKLHPLAAGETFTLGLSGTYKNQAKRIDKVTLTYKARDFIGGTKFACKPGEHHEGTLFVQSDLKISEWLTSSLNVAVAQGPQSKVTAHPRFPAKADAISHDVTFTIVSSGGVAPVWKLVKFSTGSAPLLWGQRDRVQQLVITMGPPDANNPNSLGPAAQASAFASQINAAINGSGRGFQ